MSRIRIVTLPQDLTESPQVLVVESGGGVLQRGAANIGEAVAPMRTVAIVPGGAVLTRRLRLPTRNGQQARSAAELELADELASDVAQAHVAVGPLQADGHRLACVVADARMRAWIDLLAAYDLRADQMLPDHLVLPEPAEGEPTNISAQGGELAVRGARGCFTADRETADLLLADAAVRDLSSDWQQWLIAAAAEPPINLLQGGFDPARGESIEPRRWRRLALLGGLLLLSPVAVTLASAAHDQISAGRIERETNARLAAVLPKGVAITDPAGQAQARLAQARIAAGGGVAALSAALFAAVEQIDQGQVESLIAMPDGSVRATLSFANITDLEVLRAEMRRAGLAFREEGAREEGGRAIGDVILGVRS